MVRLVVLVSALLFLLLLSVSCTGKGLSPPTSSMAIVGEWKSKGIIYCGVYGNINGQKNLFVMTAGKNNLFGRGILRILSIDDQGMPREISSLEAPIALVAPTLGLALVDEVLYVPLSGSDQTGLWVVDVSNPESPKEVAFVSTQHAPRRLALSGNMACVSAMPPGTFLFFDISDPRNPQQVSIYTRPTRSTLNIEWADSLLYVADISGVYVIDVSIPSSPKEIGFYNNPDWKGPPVVRVPLPTVQTRRTTPEELLDTAVSPGNFLDMAVSGQYAYVAASDSGLKILDVSDPVNPAETGRLELPGRARRVATSDNRAYVLEANLGDGLHLSYSIYTVDVSNASAPKVVDKVEGNKGIPPYQSLVVGEDHIYFLNHKTLLVVSIPD